MTLFGEIKNVIKLQVWNNEVITRPKFEQTLCVDFYKNTK